MAFRLRYLHHDLELTEGQFTVGRSASCQLSLDDPLVSRRHALLTVGADGVSIEDLQSRNGVMVNGARISGRVVLEPGDRIVIGAQELTLHVGTSSGTASGPAHVAKLTLPRLAVADTARSASHETEASMVRRADAFHLLGSVAEKALAMGRADEAERILASPLADVIEASRAGKKVPSALVDLAARFSARLATTTGKGAWVDYVIELYSAQRRPCPAAVIDELYNAMRRINALDLVRLREYLVLLRAQVATFGPAERFLFQRLEGLERLAALR